MVDSIEPKLHPRFGITVGVALSVVFPYWLIIVLIITLFLGTSSRSFCKGIEMWREETILKVHFSYCRAMFMKLNYLLLIFLTDAAYSPLCPSEEKSTLQILCFNLRWKRLPVLAIVWVLFTLIQVIKAS
ncbi:hypothetical protein GQ457_05G033080 [Hibiscus cannabinus]